MSLVAFGTTAADPQSALEYPDGGVFVGHFDATSLGAVTLTVEVYTQANQASDEVLHSSYTIVGPTPADPSVLVVGPIVSALPVRMEVSGASSIPFWVESVGQVTTVENGEDILATTGSEDTLVQVDYPGTFMLLVDVTTMASGDTIEIRLLSKRSLSYLTTFYLMLSGAQTNMIATLGPIVVPEGLRATIEQSAGGTDQILPWNLVRLGS